MFVDTTEGGYTVFCEYDALVNVEGETSTRVHLQRQGVSIEAGEQLAESLDRPDVEAGERGPSGGGLYSDISDITV
jgi:hypothetical protein